MKIIKLQFIMLILFSTAMFGQFTPLWQKDQARNNIPAYFNRIDDYEARLAYGFVNNNHRLYFLPTGNADSIYILNALTGNYESFLSTEGMDSPKNLYDIEVSDDGVIFVNQFVYSLSTTDKFRIYMFSTENSAPVKIVEMDGSEGNAAEIMGQYFYVSGKLSDNSLKIYVAVPQVPKVYIWSTSDNGNSFQRNEIILNSSPEPTQATKVIPTGRNDGTYYWKRVFGRLKIFDSNGTTVDNEEILNDKAYSFTIITSQNHDYGIFYEENRVREDSMSANAALYKFPNRTINQKELLGKTDSLGLGYPNRGDVDYMANNDGTYTLFVTTNNFGIAAYKFTLDDAPLPVELTSFSANLMEDYVELIWSTATEINNYGFEIHRAAGNSPNEWEKLSFVNGYGNSNSYKNYLFKDNSINNQKYFYRLKQIDFDGKFEYSDVIEINIEKLAEAFELTQNYPNPFNPSTTISFSIPETGNVILEVYNTLGERVEQLINKEMSRGNYTVEFNAGNLPSGIYLYRIQTNNFSEVKRMMLLK